MKRSDMGLVACIYAVILFFFVMTLKLKPEAQIYPLVVMVLLFLLNTGFLAQQILIARREGRKPVNDLARLFDGFQPVQFLHCRLGHGRIYAQILQSGDHIRHLPGPAACMDHSSGNKSVGQIFDTLTAQRAV